MKKANRYAGGGQSTTNHLRYPERYYNPHAILDAEVMTEQEARAEYSRLRSIARKRLERFEGLEWEDSNVYQYNKTRFKPLAEMKNFSEVAHLLTDVSKFLSTNNHPNSVSALRQQRDQVIATLHENDYTFVNKKNFKQFTDFMEEVRSRRMHVRGSPEADLFEAAAKKQISPEQLLDDFNYWIENLSALDAMPKISNKKPRGAEDYKAAIEARKKATKKKKSRKR